MTPEEAQKQTEERWEKIVETGNRLSPCGWCNWTGLHCDRCPIFIVLSQCCEVPEYAEWFENRTKRNAQKVYDLLISKREELIAAAKEIEVGVDQ